jgi:hypothetical protein
MIRTTKYRAVRNATTGSKISLVCVVCITNWRMRSGTRGGDKRVSFAASVYWVSREVSQMSWSYEDLGDPQRWYGVGTASASMSALSSKIYDLRAHSETATLVIAMKLRKTFVGY